MDLNYYKVSDIPPTVYYISNFISEEEESHILKNVYQVPKPKWTNLSNRRLQDYGGIPHEKGMIPETIPHWLETYLNKIDKLKLFQDQKPNQVLVNEYLPGQGIMPHTDGPLFYPTIATISCGSHTVLEFSENNESRNKVCEILLEPCSLVIIRDFMYSKYLHSISERTSDLISTCANLKHCQKYSCDQELGRSKRVSLTIRNVPKVLKLKLF